MHRTPQDNTGYPQDVAVQADDDLQVHPLAPMLAGMERPVRGKAVHGDERPIQHHEGILVGPAAPCATWGQGRQ
jgi:hypothetical protein